MMLFALLFAALAAASGIQDYTGSFQVKKYVWCNGPNGDGSTPGGCSVGWEGVNLNQLRSFDFDFSNRTLVRITDLSGRSWQQDLSECHAQPGDSFGCEAEVRHNEDGSEELLVRQHRPNWATLRLKIRLKGPRFSVFGPNHSFLVFQVEQTE